MAQDSDDDHMIVVIIGDEADRGDQKNPRPCSFIKKQKRLDEADIAESDVDIILDRVTKHGEYIEIKQVNEGDDVECLDEFLRKPVKNLIKGYVDSDLEHKAYMVKGCKNENEYRRAVIESRDYRKTTFYCTKCPASFSNKATVVAHENSHAGLRPYHCDSCPAAYTSDVALRRHLQTHGDKQFICDQCGDIFKFKNVLTKHIDTHQPLRKHPCEFCPRRFAQKTALRHHRNKVHLNLPAAHPCPVCPKRYARMSLVRDHMMKTHGLSMITRKMFYENLPTLSDVKVLKPAKIVSKPEIEPFPTIYFENDQRTMKIEPEETETEKPILQNALEKKIHEIWSNAMVDEQGQRVYDIKMGKAENGNMMEELMKYIKLKSEPGK